MSRRLHVFVLVDALGWELVRKRPFAQEFLPHQQPLRTLLGFSSGIIPAILTGRTPAENGMWNLVYFDPEHSPFRAMRKLGTLPARLLDNRIGRRALTEIGRRILRMGSNFDVSVPLQSLPWFHWAESRNIYARGGIPGQQSIFDRLHEQGIANKIYSHKDSLTDREILDRAAADIKDGHDEVYFLYLCELDMFLHTHRSQPAQIADKLAWYEESLTRLFRVARERDPEACLRVFSDHGMTPVARHCDLAAVVAACGFESPRDYLAVFDSTMARFWFISAEARAGICAKLRQLDYAHILTEDELRDMGVFFPDHRYGEVIALLDPGCIIAESGFNGSGWKPAGMHGYHPDDPNSSAVFLSSNVPESPMASVRDVFGCMTEALR
jgi:hypothetical protein